MREQSSAAEAGDARFARPCALGWPGLRNRAGLGRSTHLPLSNVDGWQSSGVRGPRRGRPPLCRHGPPDRRRRRGPRPWLSASGRPASSPGTAGRHLPAPSRNGLGPIGGSRRQSAACHPPSPRADRRSRLSFRPRGAPPTRPRPRQRSGLRRSSRRRRRGRPRLR